MSSLDQQRIIADTEVVFKETSEAFQRRLSDNERAKFEKFSNPHIMLTSLSAEFQRHRSRQRLENCSKKVRDFSEKLQPYFAIVDIFVQTNPEYAGIVWGAIRLILRLGANYISVLEKVAEMFHDMASHLPRYEEFIKRMEERRKIGKTYNPRLLTSLAYVYNDILDFCLDVCTMLSPKDGLRARTKSFWELSCVPFEARFSGIIQRFTKHSDMLEAEMRADAHTVAIQHYDEFQQALEEAKQMRQQKDETKLGKTEDEETKKLFKDIRRWIGPPVNQTTYDEAIRQRQEGTGVWLRGTNQFQSWKKHIADMWRAGPGGKSRFLLVHGKPGYGKTFLCASLIQDLKRSKTTAPSIDSNLDSLKEADVVFHFFDRQQQGSIEVATAFRSILAQMVRLHRHDRVALDVASTLKSGEEQEQGSQEDILTLLRWYLDRYCKTVLIIDGLDEAKDPKGFFDLLNDVLHTSSTMHNAGTSDSQIDTGETSSASATSSSPAVIVFTRPDILPPRHLEDRFDKISLRNESNHVDISKFALPRIQDLVFNGLLDVGTNVERLASQVTSHANGMFLWTKLLMDYIESDALSINDRTRALNSMVALEGLDQLYLAILSSLQRKCPKRARENIKNAFSWVAFAARPLWIHELGSAISIMNYEKAPGIHDTIPNLRESLGKISGALLEFSESGVVRFIHTSVLDYLCRNLDETMAAEHDFQLDREDFDHRTRNICLYYLIDCVSHQPLGGSSDITPDIQVVTKTYPFFRYSAEFWPHNAMAGLEMPPSEHLRDNSPSTAFLYSILSWVRFGSDGGPGKEVPPCPSSKSSALEKTASYLERFLSNSEIVKTWFEALWLFQFPLLSTDGTQEGLLASISRLSRLMSQVHPEFPNIKGQLDHLESILDTLNSRWAHVLLKNPNEIWEPSIPAFMDENPWLTSDNAEVKRLGLGPKAAPDELLVCLNSRVSTDGSFLAMLKIFCPRVTIYGRSKKEWWSLGVSGWASVYSKGWRAAFEIWSLDNQTLEANISVPLPPTQVEAMMNQSADQTFECAPSTDAFPWLIEGFHFNPPHAISGDLSKFFILDYLVTLKDLDLGGAKHPSGRACSTFDATEVGLTNQRFQKILPKGYHSPAGPHIAVFCPSDDALLVAMPFGKTLKIGRRNVKVYVLTVVHAGEMNDWKLSASISSHLPDPLPEAEKLFAFHPHRPIVAFSDHRLGPTYLWNFSEAEMATLSIHQDILQDIAFSTCGDFIHGRSVGSQYVVLPTEVGVKKICADAHITKPAAYNSSAVTKTNATVFGRKNGGVASISMLRNLREQGAVVLRTFSQDGTMQSRTLARLPEHLLHSQPVLIERENEQDGEEILRLVFNVGPSSSISWLEDIDPCRDLPFFLERTSKSVPTYTGMIHTAGYLDQDRRGMLEAVKAIADLEV